MVEEFSSPQTVRAASVLGIKFGTETATEKLLVAPLSQVGKSASALVSITLNFTKARTELKMT